MAMHTIQLINKERGYSKRYLSLDVVTVVALLWYSLSKSIIDPDHIFSMQIVNRMTDFDTLVINKYNYAQRFGLISLHQVGMGIINIVITWLTCDYLSLQ